MKLLENYLDIQILVDSIRSLRKGYITNFYPEEFLINLWITQKEFFFELSMDTIFFFHFTSEFKKLYYCSTDLKSLNDSLSIFTSEQITVTDIVTKDVSSPIIDIFYLNGFKKYSSLVRMSKINPLIISSYYPNSKIRNAGIADIPRIQTLLKTNFDKYIEQIPVYEELVKWITQLHLIVYEHENQVIGFLIYDLIGVTLYLRYWFVCAEYRDLKIGSELIKEYLFRGKETRRQIFWVIESNDNAIKRYEHYGFTRERMYDFVLIK